MKQSPKAGRLSDFVFVVRREQHLFYPFINIDDRFTASDGLVHRVESTSFRYKIPIGDDGIGFTHHIFIPAQVTSLVVIL